jgi:thiol:disulfide interchange protein DsbD
MNTFKQLMAFPMFATVVWLLWVLGHQTGVNGAAALLMWLVALAWLLWAWAHPSGRGRVWLSGVAGAGVLGLGWLLGPFVLTAQTATLSHDPHNPAVAQWERWTPERFAALQQAQQPVFVDFTAAWCVTCQFNKQGALADAEFLADVRQRQVQLLRADWTQRDPAITQALAAVQRNGVPTYVLYRPGQAPMVLSELLSAKELRSALTQLDKGVHRP